MRQDDMEALERRSSELSGAHEDATNLQSRDHENSDTESSANQNGDTGPRLPLRLLDLPKDVLDMILGELFPAGSVDFTDLPTSHIGPLSQGQTTYMLPGRAVRTTYRGSRTRDSLSVSQAGPSDAPKLNFCTAFLRVNKWCYNIAVHSLYKRRLCFMQSTLSCLAFLHDQHRKEHSLNSLYIRYTPDVDPMDWRRLFNVLVHLRSDLRELTVHFSPEFWRDAPWNLSQQTISNGNAHYARSIVREILKLQSSRPVLAVHQGSRGLRALKDRMMSFAVRLYAVVTWQGLYRALPSNDEYLGVLAQIARLPEVSGGEKRSIRIEIEGSEATERRKEFLEMLLVYVKCLSSARPDLVEERHGACTQKQLEYCCYWHKGYGNFTGCTRDYGNQR